MSKFGETAELILEILKTGKKRKSELKKLLNLKETAVLDFMEEYGLVKIDADYINITQSGLELLAE